MKRSWLVVALLVAGTATAFEGENAYGPGMHRDRHGRPFQFQTDDGQAVPGFVEVEPNGYGLGVGKDQFGRPVRARDANSGDELPAGSIDTD